MRTFSDLLNKIISTPNHEIYILDLPWKSFILLWLIFILVYIYVNRKLNKIDLDIEEQEKKMNLDEEKAGSFKNPP